MQGSSHAGNELPSARGTNQSNQSVELDSNKQGKPNGDLATVRNRAFQPADMHKPSGITLLAERRKPSGDTILMGRLNPPGTPKKTNRRFGFWLILLAIFLGTQPAIAGGRLRLQVLDDVTGEPIAARMTLFRSNGTPAPIRRGVKAGVGSAFDGQIEIRLPADTYRFTLSHGSEYHEVRGTFVLEDNSEDEKTIRIPRIVSMQDEGWIAGDPLAMAMLQPQRAAQSVPTQSVPPTDLLRSSWQKMGGPNWEIRARAEGLHAVGVTTPGGQVADAEGEEGGQEQVADTPAIRTDLVRGRGNASDLLFVGVPFEWDETDLAQLQEAGETGPSSDFLRIASRLESSASPNAEKGRFTELEDQTGPKIVIVNPMAWDLPIWLASERIDGLVVLGEYLQLSGPTLAWPNSRRPDRLEMVGPHALGSWSVFIYQQLLEAGIYLPPLGTSGAGFQPNPVGYTRTYVYQPQISPTTNQKVGQEVGQKVDRHTIAERGKQWWQNAWAGRSVITSGPLLRPKLEDQPPGHTFVGTSGQPLELLLTLQLAIRDPVDYLEVIQDGRVTYKARLDEFARQGGRIPPLLFETSGWAMVRVMTKYEDHYRAAISAPWFVTIDDQPRISAKAVEFFQTWLRQREQQLAKLPRQEVVKQAAYVRAAREFWARRAELANAP